MGSCFDNLCSTTLQSPSLYPLQPVWPEDVGKILGEVRPTVCKHMFAKVNQPMVYVENGLVGPCSRCQAAVDAQEAFPR